MTSADETWAWWQQLLAKSRTGRTTEAQDAFLKRVATSGGVSGVVRSTGDLQALLGISGGVDG